VLVPLAEILAAPFAPDVIVAISEYAFVVEVPFKTISAIIVTVERLPPE
jgi:hypothetical protein